MDFNDYSRINKLFNTVVVILLNSICVVVVFSKKEKIFLFVDWS